MIFHVYFFKVVKGCDDNPAQYMNFMNTVFTAQKQVSENVVCWSRLLQIIA